MRRIVFDIETNGFLAALDRVHCITLIDRTNPGRVLAFNGGVYADGSPAPRDGDIADGLRMLETADEIAGQNIIKFDIPAIQKVYPNWKPMGRVIDTLVMANLIYTDLYDRDFRDLATRRLPEEFRAAGLVGSQSLEAWGFRLGVAKGDYTGDFQEFTPDMDVYARQDPVTTLAMLEHLEGLNYSPEAIALEHAVARIIQRQRARGFAFNVKGAEELAATLMKRRAVIATQLQEVFPPWQQSTGMFTPKRDNKRLGYKAGVPVEKFKTVVFNPDSRDHIAHNLAARYGWKPTAFTPSGKPQIDETVLAALPYPEAALASEYLMIAKRLGQIADGKEAWLKHATDRGLTNGPATGVFRIHGDVNTNGAVTGRMTHARPNIAQTPANHAPYGEECRGLFLAAAGFVLVGCDAEGLELRCLAHFMARYDGGAYAETVVNGRKEDETDVHNVNKRAAGLNSRDSAKTFIYALIYGAGDFKLGLTVYEDFTEEQRQRFLKKYPSRRQRDGALKRLGGARRARIMENLPALGKLIDAVKAAAKRGHLIGLDGRLLHVRSEHAALNTLLQSAGALIMKKALVTLDRELQDMTLEPGRHYEFVANIHDEFQLEAQPDEAERIGKEAAAAIAAAGAHFKFRCPLSGSYAVGESWAATH